MKLYTQKHHIIPLHTCKTCPVNKGKRYHKKGICPLQIESNIIELTTEEHAEAHKQRWLMERDSLDELAYLMLSGQIGKEEVRLLAYREGYAKRDISFFQTEEFKQKISKAGKGKKHNVKKLRGPQSEDTKLKIAEKAMGNKRGIGNKGNPGPRPKVECPHCHLIGGDGIMARFHFEKCKKRAS